jgi:polyisoprenoid-binding protein YceI
MKRLGIRSGLFHLVLLAALAVLLTAIVAPRAQTSPSLVDLAVDPAQSKIQWTLGATLHTVHGTFRLKRGTLRLDTATGKASGEIVADAASGASGNDSRDKKMHKEVLESSRFPEIIFRPDRVEGKAEPQGALSVQVHGVFSVHGADHELSVPIQAELNADHWKGSGKFSVPYAKWGLKNPSTFLLKVDPAVEIELDLSGSLQKPQQ